MTDIMKKILIIEDDMTVSGPIRELLESSNFKVYSASDGVEGIHLGEKVKPDLIICDIMMPKLNGFEVIKRLKQNSQFHSIPFLFLTAKAEISDIRNGMELGADDYLTKPFKAATLLKAIEARLKRFEEIQDSKEIEEEYTKNNNRLTENDRLFVTVDNQPQFIKINEILCIKADGEYSNVILLSGKKLFIRKLLKQWEKILPENIFVRIHRSTIINISQIDKIEKWFNRSYMVRLKNLDEDFIISQRYTSKLKSNFAV